MPQLASVTLNDGTTDHAFAPRGIDTSGVATLVESTGVPVGDRRLTVSRTRTQQGREKSTLKLTLPEIQDVEVAGVTRPTIVRSAYAELTFSFDATSSTTERGHMMSLISSLLGKTDIIAVVRDLQTLY